VYELGEFPEQRPCFSLKLVRVETVADLLGRRERPWRRPAALSGVFALENSSAGG
jgi:hypothetical protein